jgi:crotonobetainyl-CoA:carnitine CoA-transferase CaiB-like acyl-CoA transferase
MDVAVQARSGVMSVTGPEGGNEPLRPGASFADFSGGIYLTTAIVTALYHRERTGRGQEVSVALLDSMMSQLISYSVAVLDGDSTITPVGSGHAQVVPYQAFPTADGHVVIAAAANKVFRTLCTILGCEQLASDPRFATNGSRVKHRSDLIPQLSAITRTRRTAAWIEALEAADIPCAPVNDLATAYRELAENSPGMVQTVEHPRAGELHQLGVPFRFSGCAGDIRLPPPMLGEHTEEILIGVLGKTDKDIESLRRKMAISTPDPEEKRA